MSSVSEKRLSVDELKQRNLPPESTPLPMLCPTAEQWNDLLELLESQHQVMARQHNLILEQSKTIKTISSTLNSLTAQAEKLVKSTAEMTSLLQQAGKKKEQWRLPKIRLPRPSLMWLWIIPIMVGLYALWPLWAILWSVVKIVLP